MSNKINGKVAIVYVLYVKIKRFKCMITVQTGYL